MSDAVDLVRGIEHDLASTVARSVTEHRLPGAAAGVVVGDELAWSYGYGFADVEAERPSTPSSLYRIASITKTFTATAIMQLRDDGALDLDDPITAHLPELAGATTTSSPIETVTLRRLLSHESGLMSDPPGTDWSTRTYETNVSTVLADPSKVRTAIGPSTQTKYSNLGFQLLGEVVTRRSGMPYGDHIRANLLEPLGMSSTAFDAPPDELAARCATGYAPRILNDRLTPAIAHQAPFSPVAEGGLWSCVDDLARWVSAQFREDAAVRGGDRILAGQTMREMHRPRYIRNDAWTEAFCIGWYARRRGEEVWIQHSGGLPGFITNVCFRPADRVGAIVLLNGIGPASDIAMDLGTMALERTRSAIEPAVVPVPVPEAYAPLLGFYAITDEHPEPVRLEWREGKLTFVGPARDDAWLPTLSPTDDPWTFTVDPGWRESGEPVVFELTDDGRVRSVHLASDTLRRLGPVD